MKKTLLTTLFASCICLGAVAQDVPTVKLSIAADGTSHNLVFALDANATAKALRIDWGDGQMVTTDVIPAYDGWNSVTVTGTPVGTGEVKVYDAEDLAVFECSSTIGGTRFTALDVTAATKLIELSAYTNDLASLDLSKNTLLQKLTINGNKLTELNLVANTALTTLNVEKNNITHIDFSKNTALTAVRISENPLEGLDVSMLADLKSLYALNCGLKNITLGDNLTKLTALSLNNNELTDFDASKLTGLSKKGSLFLMGNKLTTFTLGSVTPRTLNLSKNCFTYASLPVFTKAQVTGGYTYAPQQPMAVAETVTGSLDLSAQTNLQGFADAPQTTEFAVMTASGTELENGTDYTVDMGKINFLKDQTEKLYVTMLTPAFDKFNILDPLKTTEFTLAKVTGIDGVNAVEADAAVYTLSGVRVNVKSHQLPAGVYIVGGKKIMVK